MGILGKYCNRVELSKASLIIYLDIMSERGKLRLLTREELQDRMLLEIRDNDRGFDIEK